MSYRNLRRTGTPNDIIKRLVEAEQKAIAEKEPDDFIQIEEGRLDFEGYALEDTHIINENGKTDSDGMALSEFAFNLQGELSPTVGFMVTNEYGLVKNTNHILKLAFPVGVNAVDVTDNGHPGTLGSSITQATAPIFHAAYGAYFPRDSNSLITVADTSDIQLKTNFSVSCWIKPDDLVDGVSNPRIAGKADDASNAWIMIILTTGKLFFAVKRAGVTTSRSTNSATIAAGVPVHVCVTVANTTITIYINGISQAIGADTTPSYTVASNLVIGRHDSATSRYKGFIYYLSFYDKVLSASEVLADMNRGQLDQPFTPNLCNVEVLA